MEKRNTLQMVPEDETTREAIAAAVEAQVLENSLIPPQSEENLRLHAGLCLQQLGLEKNLESYTMITLNNRLWEDYLCHIPKSQRLVLLPVCLRSQKHCTAVSDELGLLCEECGHCAIPRLTEDAEGTGVNVLVAESNSSINQYIESGEVQAIIGISCLHSLEKAFKAMLRHGVPGFAIPLNFDGCKDTNFDESLLTRALSIHEQRPFYHIPGAAIRAHITSLFTEKTVSGFLQASTRYLSEFTKYTYGALCDNGKHYRPTIALGIYCALTNSDSFPDFLDPIALAIECFHKASLIHDDIEDADDFRYDEPTLHQRAGLSVALNIGDFLIGEGYRLLSHVTIPESIRAQLYAEAASAHCELSLGQAQEFETTTRQSVEHCIETHRLKTGPAFRVALFLGAIAAGKFDEYRDIFARFSNHLGIAYQIADDLDDTEENPASIVDTFMALEGLTRDTAREKAKALQEEYRLLCLSSVEGITDPVVKTFLYRLCGKVLKSG